MGGLLTVINDTEWDALVPRDDQQRAQFLQTVSRHVKVKDYRKSVRGPKKKKPPREPCTKGTHVSTAKLLETRKRRC